MKMYENLYTPEEIHLLRRDEFDTFLTCDHFNPYQHRMSQAERVEYEWYKEDDPCITLRGWRALSAIGIGLLILVVLALVFGREAGASSLSVEDSLDALWALDEAQEEDWDYTTSVEDEWLLPAIPSDRTPKTDEFPERKAYSEDAVSEIHAALKKRSYRVKSTEEKSKYFGTSTAKAVKRFQIDNGLEPSGVVEGETAELLGVEDSGAHYEVDLAKVAEQSTQSYIIYISTNPRKVSGPVLSVFARTLDEEFDQTYWRLFAQYDCAIGAATESGNITPVGIFLPTFFSKSNEIGNRVYYYLVGFTDELAILSVGWNTETGKFDDWQVSHHDERRRELKGRLSGGSVRVKYQVARWLYEIVNSNTYIVIDDRNYG